MLCLVCSFINLFDKFTAYPSHHYCYSLHLLFDILKEIFLFKKECISSFFLEFLYTWKYQTIWLGKKFRGHTFSENLATVFQDLLKLNIALKMSEAKLKLFLLLLFDIFLGLDSLSLKFSNFTKLCFCVDFANFFFFLEQLGPFQTKDLSLIYLRKYLFYYIWIFVLFPLLEIPFMGKLKFTSCLPYLSFFANYFKYFFFYLFFSIFQPLVSLSLTYNQTVSLFLLLTFSLV